MKKFIFSLLSVFNAILALIAELLTLITFSRNKQLQYTDDKWNIFRKWNFKLTLYLLKQLKL